ncbi:uncharacterized protein LOC125064167 [Vanessa atalanta]|uniref:uncharacterized protein LOC125064167 n=1 Tax=Vanessa atalanta TaxID=42275 RepID=UPI001FCD59FE|nr:uncharacterized protein LOC125064167 [Vanessa atalanta]
MGTQLLPGKLQKPYQLHRANSGAIQFQMIKRLNDADAESLIVLISKECPHNEIYSINLNYVSGTINLKISEIEKGINIRTSKFFIPLKSQEFWLSWYNNELCMGFKSEPPFLVHPGNSKAKNIGFIKLEVSTSIDWVIKSPPIAIKPLRYKHIDGGKLHWAKISNNKLPSDALIGGYENEPIYIARAKHNGSLCPGKYIPSHQCAYIPWGFQEYKKLDFEILCGYNAIWMKCKENYVPETVFIAGNSEVNGEHLYIGRAMIDTDLVVGKVHMLYKTCYLPYKGSEVERQTYEILVKGDKNERGITDIIKCQMNPLKAIQPCI